VHGVLGVLAEVTLSLPLNILQYFFQKIQQIPLEQLDSQLLHFISKITHAAVYSPEVIFFFFRWLFSLPIIISFWRTRLRNLFPAMALISTGWSCATNLRFPRKWLTKPTPLWHNFVDGPRIQSTGLFLLFSLHFLKATLPNDNNNKTIINNRMHFANLSVESIKAHNAAPFGFQLLEKILSSSAQHFSCLFATTNVSF